MGYDNFNSSDVHFLSALRDCSPNVVKFLKGLALGETDGIVDFGFLSKLGCRFFDGKGDYFRVVSFANSKLSSGVQSPGLRSYDEQCELYMVGRSGTHRDYSKTLTWQGVAVPKILQGGWQKLLSASSVGSVVTNAWGGQSYHNYGLAVDIVLRRLGDSPNLVEPVTVGGVTYRTLRQVYEKCGLLKWAKKCGLEWGGDWSDFPDYVHFQDTAYKPLPHKVYGDRFCLQNADNCSFAACRDYWAGKYDKEIEAFVKALDVPPKEEGTDSKPEGWADKVKGGFLFILLLVGGLVLYLRRKR